MKITQEAMAIHEEVQQGKPSRVRKQLHLDIKMQLQDLGHEVYPTAKSQADRTGKSGYWVYKIE